MTLGKYFFFDHQKQKKRGSNAGYIMRVAFSGARKKVGPFFCSTIKVILNFYIKSQKYGFRYDGTKRFMTVVKGSEVYFLRSICSSIELLQV